MPIPTRPNLTNRIVSNDIIEYIVAIENQLMTLKHWRERLVQGDFYDDGVDGPDGDGNWEPAEYCILCEKTNGRHTPKCLVGAYEDREAREMTIAWDREGSIPF